MRYKITYLICIPLMVLIGMWVFSCILDAYTIIAFHGWYEGTSVHRWHYIDIPLFNNTFFTWAYPKPDRPSFYFLSMIISVIWVLRYSKKHLAESYHTIYQICIPFMVLVGMWVFSGVLGCCTLIPEKLLGYGDTMHRFKYIDIYDAGLFSLDGIISWAYPKATRFSFYFIAAIIAVIWELKYVKNVVNTNNK